MKDARLSPKEAHTSQMPQSHKPLSYREWDWREMGQAVGAGVLEVRAGIRGGKQSCF